MSAGSKAGIVAPVMMVLVLLFAGVGGAETPAVTTRLVLPPDAVMPPDQARASHRWPSRRARTVSL